jgi:hypothetical protein
MMIQSRGKQSVPKRGSVGSVLPLSRIDRNADRRYREVVLTVSPHDGAYGLSQRFKINLDLHVELT